MNSFFKEFNLIGKDEWMQKIHADLKGQDPQLLERNDEIEEIHYSSVYHISDRTQHEVPGSFPFTRGLKTNLNDWKNTAYIRVEDEEIANKQILHYLMTGADSLWITAGKETINWQTVVRDVQLEHIHTQFSLNSLEEVLSVRQLSAHATTNVDFNVDFLTQSDASIQAFAAHFKDHQQRFALVNGFGVQQSGATTWQEIAFCLNVGHDYLIQLMDAGLTIDEASACIGFHVGIGSNYFYEVAKIRTLRSLWAKIIGAYNPEHTCSYNCSITAIIGHTNKSLNDPHTNLLRQTTEVMSALNAGVEHIVTLPHDLYSSKGVDSISARMAINIPLILKEESYLDKVIDPIGGSYALEKLTEIIGRKAWETFQTLEQKGGLFDATTLSTFKGEVEMKRQLREKAFLAGETVFIGINKFSNPDPVDSHWTALPKYLGMTPLNFEYTTKTVSA